MLCERLFQIFHFSSDGSLLSAQRCFDFHVLPILFKSQCWNISRVSVDYTCKCNAEISLWFSMSPLNSALLCFFRATYSLQVSVMKVFKSSIDYALRNFVSNLSFFFWWMSPIGTWMSPIGTALLWFFACFLFCSSLNIETIWEFRWTALANVMLRFLSVFNVSTKQCAALLLSRFLFCSSLNHEGLQIFDRLCSAKLCFKSFLFLLMEVSCRHSAALSFTFFLFCSSLNVETFGEFRWTTLANVMLRFLFGFQCLH